MCLQARHGGNFALANWVNAQRAAQFVRAGLIDTRLAQHPTGGTYIQEQGVNLGNWVNAQRARAALRARAVGNMRVAELSALLNSIGQTNPQDG